MVPILFDDNLVSHLTPAVLTCNKEQKEVMLIGSCDSPRRQL